MKNLFKLLFVVVLYSCGDQKSQEEDVIYVDDFSEIDTSNIVMMTDEEGNILYQKSDIDLDKFVLMHGVNDTIFYEYENDSSGNRYVNKMFKYEYHKEFFQVDIKDDSIHVGDEFVGYIAFVLDDKNRAIIFDGAGEKVITKDDLEQNSSLGFKVYEYRVLAENTGIMEFNGKIVIREEEFPFEYKYVVIAKDTIDQGL